MLKNRDSFKLIFRVLFSGCTHDTTVPAFWGKAVIMKHKYQFVVSSEKLFELLWLLRYSYRFHLTILVTPPPPPRIFLFSSYSGVFTGVIRNSHQCVQRFRVCFCVWSVACLDKLYKKIHPVWLFIRIMCRKVSGKCVKVWGFCYAKIGKNVYSGPYILRPPIHPEKYGLKFEVILKKKGCLYWKYKAGVTDVWS